MTVYKPAKGDGRSVRFSTRVRGSVVYEGDGYTLARTKKRGILLVHVDADRWKRWIHDRIRSESGLTLFEAPPREHLSLATHLAAEREADEYRPGRPPRLKWERRSRTNHWLDATYLACAAGHYAGARLKAIARGEGKGGGKGKVNWESVNWWVDRYREGGV